MSYFEDLEDALAGLDLIPRMGKDPQYQDQMWAMTSNQNPLVRLAVIQGIYRWGEPLLVARIPRLIFSENHPEVMRLISYLSHFILKNQKEPTT
jgi:hypothetical protein